MKVDSPEYKALMKKWADESWNDEIQSDYESYIENEDSHGRLLVKNTGNTK